VYFQRGNVTGAKTLDPFTHVYMFDTGFHPSLFDQLAIMFNASASAEFLISCVSRKQNKTPTLLEIELVFSSLSLTRRAVVWSIFAFVSRHFSPLRLV